MTHRKLHLPEKTCVVCQKPFAWRKKWERCWEEVRYCSERCRRQRQTPSSTAASSTATRSRTD